MTKLKLVLALVFAVLGLILIVQNMAAVDARIFFVTRSVSLAVLLLVAMGIGFALGLSASLFLAVKRKPPE